MAASTRASTTGKISGTAGWDTYAAFYDWENARTVGTRDIAFWTRVARREGGRVLELGCGTGRILRPLLRAGIDIRGVDMSWPMLARATARLERARHSQTAGRLVRADIRALPFRNSCPFNVVIAPYGILQSLLSDAALRDTLRAVRDVLAPGGLFGVDLVPDVPHWKEYDRRVTLTGARGPRGLPVKLIESVTQDAKRRLTVFDQEYVEGTGRAARSHRFSLAFRSLTIAQMRRRLENAGFLVDAVLGDYRGGPWAETADTWILLARRPRARQR